MTMTRLCCLRGSALVALLLCACTEGGQGSDDGAPKRDAGYDNPMPDSGPPDLVEPGGLSCEPGTIESHAAGVVTAPLSGRVLALSELGQIDGERFASTRIALFDGGALVGGHGGFWEVTGRAPVRWIAQSGNGAVSSFLAVDLDGDGTDDLVTFEDVHRSSNDMTGFFNQFALWQGMNGAFVPRSTSDASAFEVEDALAAGDVDRDGIVDLALIALGRPTLFRGDGMFGLAAEQAGPALELLRVGAAVASLNLVDADGDGALDLVGVLDNAASGVPEVFVAFLPGDGEGRFGEATISELGESGLVAVTPITDVTGDGLPDVVLWAGGDDRYTFHVAVGRGDGGFERAEPVHERTGSNGPGSVVLADSDADGVKDIVAVTQEGILVLRASSDLAFDAEIHQVPRGVEGIAVADATASSPARLHALLRIEGCRAECTNACAGQCLFGLCVKGLGADDDAGADIDAGSTQP